MKKSFAAIVVAAALVSGAQSVLAASTVLYTEDWGSTNGGRSFAAVGWTGVVASPANPPYVGFYSAGGANDANTGAALPTETMYFTGMPAGQTGMFYTTAGAGNGGGGDTAFTAIDPTQFQSVTLSVEGNTHGAGSSDYFAVQVGGAWYVSVTPLGGSSTSYPQFALASTVFTPQAGAWNQLTIGANSVTIGSVATANLNGVITGIGIVQVGPGGWDFNEIIVSAAPSPIVYTEDWGTTNGGRSFSAVGWTGVVASPANPPYVGFYSAGGANDANTGAALPTETMYFTGMPAAQTGMFYTTAGAGNGGGGDSAFNPIDPTQHTGLTLSVEGNTHAAGSSDYFAVQVGGAWYVSATALNGSSTGYPQFALASTPYTTTASAWKQLTINANSVTIGSTASADLAGPITGIGIVQVGPGGWDFNEIIVSATVPQNITPPLKTLYSEDFGTATFNATGVAAAATTDVGWSTSGIAYTGMYAAPGSIDPVTGATFPPPPVGNVNGTNNAFYASLDSASSTGIFYTTDTNGASTDGTSSFSDINPANYPGGIVLNAESEFNSATRASNYFAVKVGGQWYVSKSPNTNNALGNPIFLQNSLVYTNPASAWNTLSFAEGGVNAAGPVSIGSQAAANLSGPITGIGVVVVGDPNYAGGTTGYGINYASVSVTTPLVNTGSTAPIIDAAGFSQVAYAGGTASFAVDAFVGSPVSYMWTFAPSGGGSAVVNNGFTGTGSFVSGAASSVLTISNISSADAGTYSVQVSNAHGSDDSTNYTTNTLTVVALPGDVLYAETFPVVGPFAVGESPSAVGWTEAVAGSDNPNRLDGAGSLFAYETAATTIGFFTSTTSDTPGLSGLPFPTINPSSHSFLSFRANIADPTASTAGSIYFAVEMAGGKWYASSSALQLAANPRTTNVYGLQFDPSAQQWNNITISPSAVTIGSQASANLTGNIIGAGLVFSFTGTSNQYFVTSFAMVTDPTPPVLASFPSQPYVPYSQTIYTGAGASFSFTEAGSLPLTNRWQFNDNGTSLTDGVQSDGSIISGSQTTFLTIQNASATDAGAYDAYVSNPAGTQSFNTYPGSIYGPPTLTVQAPPLGLIYNEAFPLYQETTVNQPFSIIGWTNQSDVPTRLYELGTPATALVGNAAAYAYEGTETNSLFYASTTSDTGFSGLPFIAFDPANYPANSIQFTTSMEAGNASYTNVSASFAVQQGGQWYAMATPIEPASSSASLSTSAFTGLGPQTYSPLASQWKTVTLVGTAGVVVGGAPAHNLSGPITAAGLLFQHFGTSGGDLNYNLFNIQAVGSGSLIGGVNIGAASNGVATVTWIGNAAVQLQSATTLTGPNNWHNVNGTVGQHSYRVSTTSPTTTFYRLVQHP